MTRYSIVFLLLSAFVTMAADTVSTNAPATNAIAVVHSPTNAAQQVLVIGSKTYKRPKLLRRETSGFVVMHSGGIVTLRDSQFLRGEGFVKYEKTWHTPAQINTKLKRPEWTPTYSSSRTRDDDKPWRRSRPKQQPVDWGAVSRELGRPVRSWDQALDE